MFKINQRVFNNTSELSKYLSTIRIRGSLPIISIDGNEGSGKSTLAKNIQSSFPISYIELDKYLIKNIGKYVDAIKYDELLNELNSNKTNNIILIEGICILKVLTFINIKPYKTIYVKKIRNGLWVDEKDFNLNSSIEEIFSNYRYEVKQGAELFNEPFVDTDVETIFHEIVRYHFENKPHIFANIIYENI